MKPTIGITITNHISPLFLALAKKWPSLQYGIMAEIGYHGRRALYEEFERGQVIDLRAYPYDKRGKRTVSYSAAKNGKSVKVRSYPLNLYKPEDVYNAATGVVLQRVEAALQGYDDRVLQKRLEDLQAEAKK